ncbi:hypothetical protein [Spiroplasma sp. SV19]|uniref:hypothetical protein n=1 Tax=Spiroplasma sp. SV19 TaxID=2570468 RepID=UPI0024B6A0B7|nr:hypothetical protein [Spiroplasma sp. SV19]WHQ36386.1 hypothetical protein E7Y35_00290 [Spiroplasma sp. SV19]
MPIDYSNDMWNRILIYFKNKPLGRILQNFIDGSFRDFYNDKYLRTNNEIILFYFLIRNNKDEFHDVNQHNSNILIKI